MKKMGILGKKISYTLSPFLHNTIFDLEGIKGEYEIFDSEKFENEKEFLSNLINKIRKEELLGINVTIPYKEEIMKYLDEIDENAQKIGAVNTIKFEKGVLKGYNTDYMGIVATLEKMKLNLENQKIYILGTGGSSKAVVEAVKNLNGTPILVSRNKNNTDIEKTGVKIIDYWDLENLSENQYLIVNCTPAEISPKIIEKFDNLFELKYAVNMEPYKNKNAQNGLYMLVVQGIKSEEIWQGIKINSTEKIYEIMKDKIR